jgi:WD40 repeat protein
MAIVSVSPDNEKVLLSSDQGIVYLCTINKDGYYTSHLEYKGKTKGYYKIHSNCFIILVSEEPSLSCAWNQSSDTFAVSSQDGYVSVYNMHSMQRLCQLGSSEV